jgi:hypothetical protein
LFAVGAAGKALTFTVTVVRALSQFVVVFFDAA